MEELWIPIGILRSNITKLVKGGISDVARCVARNFFGATDDSGDNGVVLAIESKLTSFFARVTNSPAGDETLTRIYDVRGASSLLPFVEYKNVLPDYKDVNGQSYFVNLSCSDTSRFDRLTDEDMWDRVDQVQDAHAEWQQNNLLKKAFETKTEGPRGGMESGWPLGISSFETTGQAGCEHHPRCATCLVWKRHCSHRVL